MELCRSVPDLDELRRTAAPIRTARDVQRASLDDARGCIVAHAADQLSAVGMVYQQTHRWLNAGCFEAMVNDLRSLLRVAQQRQGQSSAVILDGRTLQSTCESGPRAGYDGYKHTRGSKL